MERPSRIWITKFAVLAIDEPLKGNQKGQRSVRLNRAYRVIYGETESGNIILVGVLDVSKHEY